MIRGGRADPRTSLLPATVAVLAGLLGHAVDQLLFFRAGPVPIVVAGAVIAPLVALRYRPAMGAVRLVALGAWAALVSGVGVVLVYIQALSRDLPRPLSGPEMVVFDLGMFLWFVLALAGCSALAVRRSNPKALLVLAAAPAVQGAYGLVLPVLVAVGIYS